MIPEFETTVQGIVNSIALWEKRLAAIPEAVLTTRRNGQNRTIKQILGHLIDSASNNTHRIVHLQYQPSPFHFPNYATNGNNDRWIAIQNYQGEDWDNLIQLWKHSNLHLAHVIANIDPDKLGNEWVASEDTNISLKSMVLDYVRHLELHMGEIEELMKG